MATQWLVRRGEKTTTPLSSTQLKECARQGQVKPTDLVAKAGTDKWHPASKVQGLFLPNATGGEIIAASPNTSRVTHLEPQFATEVETDVWSGRPSLIAGLKTYILGVLFFWTVVPVFVAVKRALILRSIRYELTTQRLRITSGVLSQHVQEVELYRIKDSAFLQTLPQRLLHLGSIQLVTSDKTTPIVMLQAIPAAKAKDIREKIRAFTEELRARKGIREFDHV